jgi:hypothetical protein
MPWMKDRSGRAFKTGTGGGPRPGPAPTLTSLAPPSVVVATPTLVTLTGTGFSAWSKVWADEEAQVTTFVNPTTLTYHAEADQEGSQTITVHDPNGVSNAVELDVGEQPV